MRRRCTCGAVDCAGWRWRRGVLTESGWHRFDGNECQLKLEELHEVDGDEVRAQALYESERLPHEKTWAALSEQARDIWRLHVKAGL